MIYEEIHRYSCSNNNVHLKLAYRKITKKKKINCDWLGLQIMILNLYNSMFYWDFNNPFFIADSMRNFIHFTCNVPFCVQKYFFIY